ncbi:MAG TPA: ATP synthase F0 subunit C [bacterium]|nr:ATP synthase F0 subunit C [bacterium]
MKRKSLFILGILLLVVASPLYAATGELTNLGLALGAGLGIGIAAGIGGIGQGLAVASAMEGIARNPSAADRIFTPMIVGLALIESLVIYALVIAFILQGKI